jgi:hypothetical protein
MLVEEMMVIHGEWDDWSVSHCGLAIYMKKYLKAKRKNYGNSNISPCKKKKKKKKKN